MNYFVRLSKFLVFISAFCCSAAYAATVTIQPIIVSDDDGTNTSAFFGDPDQQAGVEGRIDTIWSQAGIDVNFLAPSSFNNTLANRGREERPSNVKRPGDAALESIIDQATIAGVINTEPYIVNMFLVNTPPGFSEDELDVPNGNFFSSAGYAFPDGSGFLAIGGNSGVLDNVAPEGALDVLANTAAHEIGHILELRHPNEDHDGDGIPNGPEDALNNTSNLMHMDFEGRLLTASQIEIALRSDLSVETSPIPVPAAVWLFGTGLLTLFSFNRRKLINGQELDQVA